MVMANTPWCKDNLKGYPQRVRLKKTQCRVFPQLAWYKLVIIEVRLKHILWTSSEIFVLRLAEIKMAGSQNWDLRLKVFPHHNLHASSFAIMDTWLTSHNISYVIWVNMLFYSQILVYAYETSTKVISVFQKGWTFSLQREMTVHYKSPPSAKYPTVDWLYKWCLRNYKRLQHFSGAWRVASLLLFP